MMKHKIITSVMAVSLLFPTLAIAQEDSGTDKVFRAPLKLLNEVKNRMEIKKSSVPTLENAKNQRVELETRKASSTERRLEVKSNIETRKASTTLRNEARKASTTARRIEIQQDVAKRLAEHTGQVLTSTVERLENILARLESRIAKIKANGVDTSLPESFVVETKTHLSEARRSIEIFASIDLTGDKAKENFQKIRETAAQVKVYLKEAQESLKKAVRALKPEGKVETTTTTEAQ